MNGLSYGLGREGSYAASGIIRAMVLRVRSSQNRGVSCHSHDMMQERSSRRRVPGRTILGTSVGWDRLLFLDCKISHPSLEPLAMLFSVFQ